MAERLNSEQVEQLPLEGFIEEEELYPSVPLRLRLVTMGKLLWSCFRHPNLPSEFVMDVEGNRVLEAHGGTDIERMKADFERMNIARRLKPL